MNNAPLLTDTPPLQYNYCRKTRGGAVGTNYVVHWSGSDTQDLYNKNLKDNTKHAMLTKLAWVGSDIEYSYNSHGFRCEEFDNRPCALALGCSFTEGTGLHLYQTWPAHLSNMLNLHVWNLGSGGGSVDTVFRILDHYITRLHPKYVFILIPPESRFEYQDIHGGFPIIQPHSLNDHEKFGKEWLAQPGNGKYNTRKTMLAIQQLCRNFDIPVFFESFIGTQEYSDRMRSLNIHLDLARDLLHNGVVYQQWAADHMYRDFTNKIKLVTNE